MDAHMAYTRRESPAAKLSEQWTCADVLLNVKNKMHKSRYGKGWKIFKKCCAKPEIRFIFHVSHCRREIHKADRLNFKIVPNRHQATDFYQIKIELYKQIRYDTNVTGFGGGCFKL